MPDIGARHQRGQDGHAARAEQHAVEHGKEAKGQPEDHLAQQRQAGLDEG
jgi:hypothetical protein